MHPRRRRIRKLIRHILTPGLLLHRLRWHVWSPEAAARWTDARLDVRGYFWLFIMGVNNSGTTLLERVIASHPTVRSLPKEGWKLTHALPRSGPFGVGRVWSTRLDLFRWTEDSDAACLARVRYDWAYYIAPRPGIIVEKTPHNALRSRWLQRHFAPSRFLAIVRSPYAVCEGIRRHRPDVDIAAAAQHWVRTNEVMRQDAAHLERWLLVTYEDLCDQPEKTLSRLEAFLELDPPFDRRILERRFRIRDQDHPIQNMNARSVARLSADDIRRINEVAGPLMTQLGYALLTPDRERTAQ